MSASSRIRILIADDHLIVRTGLRSIIESQPDMEIVAEAITGEQAVELFFSQNADVVLMDLRLPALGGVDAIRAIRQRRPEARAIVLTTYESDENIYRALQAGARAYLLKDIPRDDLLQAIRAVHSGQYCLPPAVAARLAQRFPIEDLSSREIEILRHIVRGLSNKEIASALSISESTVKNHVNSLLSKLRVHDRTGAATTALRHGIISLE